MGWWVVFLVRLGCLYSIRILCSEFLLDQFIGLQIFYFLVRVQLRRVKGLFYDFGVRYFVGFFFRIQSWVGNRVFGVIYKRGRDDLDLIIEIMVRILVIIVIWCLIRFYVFLLSLQQFCIQLFSWVRDCVYFFRYIVFFKFSEGVV